MHSPVCSERSIAFAATEPFATTDCVVGYGMMQVIEPLIVIGQSSLVLQVGGAGGGEGGGVGGGKGGAEGGGAEGGKCSPM